uniref:Uncharacterized protein n=1 Tax=Plectus sambesii TaxID=2011161 RepID=A0A914WCK2_9BILA
MGGSSSAQLAANHETPTLNDLINNLPKMMRVADDMHRMTNYMMDLRNITILITVMSIIGGIGFLIFKYMQYKNRGERRRHYDMDDNRRYSPYARQWLDAKDAELHKVVTRDGKYVESPARSNVMGVDSRN